MKLKKTGLLGTKSTFWGKWFLLSLIVGVAAGLAAIAFQFLVQVIHYFALTVIVGLPHEEVAGEHSIFGAVETGFVVWLIVPVMALGGLITGFIVYRFAPEAEGHGTDGVIDAFHNRRGVIPMRIPIVKTIASAITLGTGGSAGKEGPIAQIAAGFSSFISRLIKMSTHDRRVLIAIGMGAGIGAIFRAPLAGAIFAGEILYRDADIESEVIIPGAIASVVGYSVFQLSLPIEKRFIPLFGDSAAHEVASLAEFIPYTILALALVLFSILYVKMFTWSQELFRKIPIWPHLKPCLGAIAAGIVVVGTFFLFNQELAALAPMGSGYGLLQEFIESSTAQFSIALLFGVAIAKIITTSLTIGSGGSGGVFGPSMVIGGAVGAGVGKTCQQLIPAISIQPTAFAIVGMAGFFAGCANAPFSTMLMVTELTGDYRLLVPTLWVSTVCFILCRPWSLYSKQVDSRLDSPAHMGDFTVDLLADIRVADAYRETTGEVFFREADSLDDIVHALAKSSQRYFHVYSADDKLVGIFSSEDVRRYLYDDVLWKIANARDVMNEDVVTLQTDDDLNLAIGKFTELNVDELPVVSSDNKHKVIGVLRRKETIALYNKRRLEMQKQKDVEHN